jgi:hypothetical protein
MMQPKRKAVMAVAAALVAAGICGCGPEQYKADTSGGEEAQRKVQQGQPLYTPPPGAPVPGGGQQGGRPPGAPR